MRPRTEPMETKASTNTLGGGGRTAPQPPLCQHGRGLSEACLPARPARRAGHPGAGTRKNQRGPHVNQRAASAAAGGRRGRAPLDAAAARRRQLQHVDIFRDLNEAQLREVERSMRETRVGAGRAVYQPDEIPEALFLLKTGSVQISRISPDGKRFVIANIEPGALFGEMALLGQSASETFAEALEDSTLGVLRRQDVERIIVRFPLVGVRIMQTLAERLSEAETQLEDLALKSLTARLAALILRLTSAANAQLSGLTHNDLAERVGTSRETATQALNELKAAGLIRIGRKRIDVVDRAGLRGVAETY